MSKIAFLFLFASIFSLAASAQSPTKIGYADVEYILTQLPAAKQLEEHLKTLETDLVKNLQLKQAEFKTKYDEFVKTEKTMLPALRENAARELQMLEENLTKFQQDIQKTLQDRQDVLSRPIFQNIGNAIAEVGKENGFTLVLNPQIGGIDAILFANESMDISDLVLKKMGVTPTPPTTPATAASQPAATKPAPTQPAPKKN